MKIFFSIALHLVLSLFAVAQDKTDAPDSRAKQLIGVWDLQDDDLARIDGKATFDFLPKGKAKFTLTLGKDQPIIIEGTYKLEGDSILLTAPKDGKDQTEKVSIKTFTAQEVVLFSASSKKEVKLKKPIPPASAAPGQPTPPFKGLNQFKD